jgi:hypothetical protein
MHAWRASQASCGPGGTWTGIDLAADPGEHVTEVHAAAIGEGPGAAGDREE